MGKIPADANELVNLFFEYVKKEYNVSKKDIELVFKPKKESLVIPLSILRNRELGGFEAIVKYLKENIGLNNSEISDLTNRSRSTIGVTYHNSKKKLGTIFSPGIIDSSEYNFPISLIASRKFSVLESIVKYLKEEHALSYQKISIIINRDSRTVWTVYRRAQEKNES